MVGGRFERKDTSPAVRLAFAYAMLATLATALALALRADVPWLYPTPWVALSAANSHLASAALGVGTAFIVIAATRLAVIQFAWARRLHHDLRPVARDLNLSHVLMLAGFSSLGEELLFRGLLVPTIGIVVSSLVFGLAHQIKGPSRWPWVACASAVGLAFAAIFSATGSLIGPLVAHALINAANLRYLRDHDPEQGLA